MVSREVFISYRRDDTETEAGRLADAIRVHFGEDSVFVDTSDTRFGAVWPDVLRKTVEQAAVVIAVIGPEWILARDEDGRRRIDDTEDWVRRELELGLERGKTIIPLLVRHAKMPRAHALPQTLAPVASMQAFSIRGETWTQVFSAPAEQRPLLDVIFLTKDLAIAVGAYGAYYDSQDGGKTWNARKVLQDDKHLNAILELGDNHLLLVGEAGTMLTSEDLGKTWMQATAPYKGSFFGGLVANDGSVLVYGLRGHIFRSADKGKTWKAVENKSTAALIGGDKLPDGALVVAGNAGKNAQLLPVIAPLASSGSERG